MTPDDILEEKTVDPANRDHSEAEAIAFWLKEIAYQLSLINERWREGKPLAVSTGDYR